jgi:hypothetical protein
MKIDKLLCIATVAALGATPPAVALDHVPAYQEIFNPKFSQNEMFARGAGFCSGFLSFGGAVTKEQSEISSLFQSASSAVMLQSGVVLKQLTTSTAEFDRLWKAFAEVFTLTSFHYAEMTKADSRFSGAPGIACDQMVKNAAPMAWGLYLKFSGR